MKKLLWSAGIFFALLLVLLLGLSLFVKSYLQGERLKAIIIPKAEALTGRKVSIDQIHVSLLRGVIVRGISIKEDDGKKDFITAREFILDYRLVPLLKKQLVIKKVELISPFISLKKEGDDRYNFSSIPGKVGGAKGEGAAEDKEREFPLSIITDKVRIRDARVRFSDAQGKLPDMTAEADMEIALSTGKDLRDIAVSGHLVLKSLKTAMKGIVTETSGSVDMDKESIRIDLSTALGKDKVRLSGKVRDYFKSPDLNLDLFAKELDIGKLLAASEATKGEKGDVRGKVSPGGAAGPKGGEEKKFRASGEVKVDLARYKEYTIKDFNLKYRYGDGVLTIEPLDMRLLGGDRMKVDGSAKGNLRFAFGTGEGAAVLMRKTLRGRGSVDLTRCEVGQSGITDAIALFTGVEDLRRPRFDSVRLRFDVRDEKVYIGGDMSSSQLRVVPVGNVGFDERIDMTADLELSPALAAKLPTAKLTGYMKNEKGWNIIPLKITGTVGKPAVGLNPASVGKQVERGIREEIGKRLLKGRQQKGVEEQSKDRGRQDFFKGIFGK